MTLAKTFGRCLGHNLLVVLALSVALIFAVVTQEDIAVRRPPAKGSARRMVERTDCGDDIEEPTRVIVTIDGVTRVGGQKLTDKAIEQAVFGVDHGITVHAFCQ